MNKHNSIIFFDGECKVCNFWINFVLKRDIEDKFIFASLHSTIAKDILKRLNILQNVDSIIFLEEGKLFMESDAVLKICNNLRGWSILCKFVYLIPRKLRNSLYKWVAKNRHKIMGNSNHCIILTVEERKKFL